MDLLQIRPLSELRAVLEAYAARRAALHARDAPETLRGMRAILERMAGALRVGDYAAFQRADFELHSLILQLAQVPLLLETWRPIWERLLSFHRQTFEECMPDARVLAEEHEHLVETIALGDPAAAEDAARNHIEAIWFRLVEYAGTDFAPEGDPLQRTTAHLAYRLHCPLKLSEIAAKIAFTSPGNLSRLFRKRYGVSFQGYLQKLRMEKAAELLSKTGLPIARIARRVGYGDTSRFGQHFRRLFGETPQRYGKRFRRADPSESAPRWTDRSAGC
jgi:AraC-like DNA-binding protein